MFITLVESKYTINLFDRDVEYNCREFCARKSKENGKKEKRRKNQSIGVLGLEFEFKVSFVD